MTVMSDMNDPRIKEFRDALADVNRGLRAPAGAHERYRQSLFPYVQCICEMTPADHKWARKTIMAALFQGGIPLGVISVAFKATTGEIGYVSEHPPIEPEPIDEQERLAALPYGMYLKTRHWGSVRKQALLRAGNRCTLCNSGQNLEVHHRTYERRGAERPADVVVLCGLCHGRHHGQLRSA